MNTEEKIALITRNTEEVITHEELRKVLQEKKELKAYIGFEPSGIVHIGWKICANKINDLTKAGFEVVIFLADWHAYINDKLNGNIENIRSCGKYMEDCFLALGVDKEKVKFVYANEFVNKAEYWEKVLKIGKNSTLARVKRALTIMGRKEDEVETDTSKLIYPLMQSADIFQLNVDIAYGGIDQRKAHMLTRDVAEKLGWKKPIALHTPLLAGLNAGERMEATFFDKEVEDVKDNFKEQVKQKDGVVPEIGFQKRDFIVKNKISKDEFVAEIKMSKSSPDSCIYIHDSEEEIKRKIKKAFCPEKVINGNPIIDICKYIIFPELESWKFNEVSDPGILQKKFESGGGELEIKNLQKTFLIERPEKFGGSISFESFASLEKQFADGKIHPMDLKNAVTKYLNNSLISVREYFTKHPENYEKMMKTKITR